MPRASGGGTSWGPKPVQKRAAPARQTRRTARVLCPRRTRETAVGSVVTRAGCTWLTPPRPKTGGCGACRVRTAARGVPKAPGVEEAATGHSRLWSWHWGTPTPRALPWEDMNMPMCGREDGGGGGATGLVVMPGTGCRSARRGVPHRLSTPAPGGGFHRVASERQAPAWREQGPGTSERSQTIRLDSGVRRKAPAPFGRGERL